MDEYYPRKYEKRMVYRNGQWYLHVPKAWQSRFVGKTLILTLLNNKKFTVEIK